MTNVEIEKKTQRLIFMRSSRWIFILITISSMPVILTIIIIGLFQGDSSYISDYLRNSIMNGSFVIIALTLHCAKYVDLTYSRDYDLANNQEFSWITIPFLFNVILGVLLFTSLNTVYTVKSIVQNNKNINYFYGFILSITLLIIFVSIIHSFFLHHFSLRHQRQKKELYLPTVDGEMNCDICKVYFKNRPTRRTGKSKLHPSSIINDKED